MNGNAFKFLLIIVATASVAACNPFKVTDPSDPRFNPDRFSFRDYPTREEKIDAFRKLFPPGTPKTFVDRVLVEAGGATLSRSPELSGLWRYSEPPRPFLPHGPDHNFIFDESNKVKQIGFALITYLYPGQATVRELREDNKLEEK